VQRKRRAAQRRGVPPIFRVRACAKQESATPRMIPRHPSPRAQARAARPGRSAAPKHASLVASAQRERQGAARARRRATPAAGRTGCRSLRPQKGSGRAHAPHSGCAHRAIAQFICARDSVDTSGSGASVSGDTERGAARSSSPALPPLPLPPALPLLGIAPAAFLSEGGRSCAAAGSTHGGGALMKVAS
jgi:hypothetical protein